ncbi:flagellar biosynthesis protein FlhA [Stieleria varia]|uniref:Flagellar biosynthesis protein FlhA n=1 Tax=Stieleria varia TaxID=2528005 RepID=A0A5C6AL51_9BACT|nr:flagellar biosynthesis protein FlhA [Stieleria varia]TWU00743.1 Flagellar biosynthesis protein FlhA [Stieleria varia]
MQALQRYRDYILPVGIISCLLVILVPLPTAIMDFLLAANITAGVIILLTTIHVATPLEFSVFPTLLLATTLARLVLNIATTRLILTGAETRGLDAAGGVVRSFGQFVAGDQIEVGLILFLILIVVQFVVITKGSTRISEVAARFALDGMPGKQSAIDADLNAGVIDSATAGKRRAEVADQADFYSAMDGAGKFVRGDAIAGLLITAVNIIGGLYIGVIHAKMEIGTAASTFTKLTIGDGLVSQVPALLISLAAGILVSRSSRRTNLSSDFISQLLGSSKSLYAAGVFLCLLIFTGLPAIPLALLGGGCITMAVILGKQEAQREAAEREPAKPATATQKRVEDFLTVDPMEVSIGIGLLALADPARGGDLMQRISNVRNQMAGDIGIVLPKVRVRDESTLAENEYEIRINGNLIAKGDLRPDKILAIDDGRTTGTVSGEKATPREYALPSIWIDADSRDQALIYGYKTQTPVAALVEHLEMVARSHADELLSRDATKHLIDELRSVAPAIVDELIPQVVQVHDVQYVLRSLLNENVTIRQLGLILESLGEIARTVSDPVQWTEHVRRGLSRTLCAQFRDASNTLHVVELSPELNDQITNALSDATFGPTVSNQSDITTKETQDFTCKTVRQAVKNLLRDGHPPVLLVSAEIRPIVKQITRGTMPWLNVLSHREITRDTTIQSHSVAGTQKSIAA